LFSSIPLLKNTKNETKAGVYLVGLGTIFILLKIKLNQTVIPLIVAQE
jgi:hypothetical protein